jgi:hypothetical protein
MNVAWESGGCRDTPEQRVGRRRIGRSQIRVIHGVQRLGPQLQTPFFGERPVLEHRKVPDVHPGRAHPGEACRESPQVVRRLLSRIPVERPCVEPTIPECAGRAEAVCPARGRPAPRCRIPAGRRCSTATPLATASLPPDAEPKRRPGFRSACQAQNEARKQRSKRTGACDQYRKSRVSGRDRNRSGSWSP